MHDLADVLHRVHAVEEHTGERTLEDLDAAEARGADGVAVERSVEREEARALRTLDGDLDRHFDRSRTVVRVKYMIQAAGCDGDQIARELGGGAVRDSGERDVRQRFALLAERAEDARVSVAERRGVPGRI